MSMWTSGEDGILFLLLVASILACDNTWMPDEPKFNTTDSTLRFSVVDPCWKTFITIGAQNDNGSLKPVNYTEQGNEVIVQLTNLQLSQNQPATLLVGNVAKGRWHSTGWPNSLNAGRVELNMNNQVNVTTTETEGIHHTTTTLRETTPYNITCIITTPNPIADIDMKIMIGCVDQPISVQKGKVLNDEYGRTMWQHTAQIQNHLFTQPFAPISVPIYCGGSWVNPSLPDYNRVELGKAFLKHAVIYAMIYKKDCVTSSYIIKEDNSTWVIKQRYQLDWTVGLDEVQTKCTGLVNKAEQDYCHTVICSSCQKYCHPRSGFELSVLLNATTQTISWFTFSECFPMYTVYYCQHNGGCGNQTSVRATTNEGMWNFSNVLITENVYWLYVTLEGVEVEGRWIQESIKFPQERDIPNPILRIATKLNITTVAGNLGQMIEVTSDDVIDISCRVDTPSLIRRSVNMKLFVGCTEWNSSTWLQTKLAIHDPYHHRFYISAESLMVSSLSHTVPGYVPVMCFWKWTLDYLRPSDFARITLVHLKILGHDGSKPMIKLSDEASLKYPDVTKDNFIIQCKERSRNKWELCRGNTCTKCDLKQKPCLNNGKCDETQSTCDCSEAIGYEGEQCNRPTQACGQVTCTNGGQCSKVGAELLCTCQEGYSGVTCEIPDVCSPNPCSEKWMTCKKYGSMSTDASYVCQRNEFIEQQIKINIECSSNDSQCNETVANSACHHRGFCYCPRGTVKTADSENAIVKVSCQPGKLQCRTQQDCSWLSDEYGYITCFNDSNRKEPTKQTSTCNCFNKQASDLITGLCTATEVPKTPPSNAGKSSAYSRQWWRYTLFAIIFLVLLLLIFGACAYNKQKQRQRHRKFNESDGDRTPRLSERDERIREQLKILRDDPSLLAAIIAKSQRRVTFQSDQISADEDDHLPKSIALMLNQQKSSHKHHQLEDPREKEIGGKPLGGGLAHNSHLNYNEKLHKSLTGSIGSNKSFGSRGSIYKTHSGRGSALKADFQKNSFNKANGSGASVNRSQGSRRSIAKQKNSFHKGNAKKKSFNKPEQAEKASTNKTDTNDQNAMNDEVDRNKTNVGKANSSGTSSVNKNNLLKPGKTKGSLNTQKETDNKINKIISKLI